MKDKFHLSFDENVFLARKLLAENIYSAAKLEGVNTTFPETAAILDGINVPSATLDDIRVISNLRDAWRDALSNLGNIEIDLEFIKNINANVSRNESLAWGKLRDGAVGISGTNYKPEIPNEIEVGKKIREILHDFQMSNTERALDLMLFIMRTQLFWDGNKRTANIVANAVLIKSGAGILLILQRNQVEFNQKLTDFYDNGDATDLKNFLYEKTITDFGGDFANLSLSDKNRKTEQETEQETEQAEKIAKLLREMRKNPEKYYSLRELMSLIGLSGRPNFLQNYLHPALKQGKILRKFPESLSNRNQKYKIAE